MPFKTQEGKLKFIIFFMVCWGMKNYFIFRTYFSKKQVMNLGVYDNPGQNQFASENNLQ